MANRALGRLQARRPFGHGPPHVEHQVHRIGESDYQNQQGHNVGQHVDRLADQPQRTHRPDGTHGRAGPDQQGRSDAAEQEDGNRHSQGHTQVGELRDVAPHVLEDLHL